MVRFLKVLAGMAILAGNTKPKPEQVSKLVKEAMDLESLSITKLSTDLWGIFFLLKYFSFKNAYKFF